MANNYISQALAADGKLYTWGYNTYGQLGINSTTNSTTPAAEYSGLTQWRGLAVGPGANHALVLGQGAAVFMAGYNSLGQLGDGTTTNSLVYIRNQARCRWSSRPSRPRPPARPPCAWPGLRLRRKAVPSLR
ncbi:hypothetical protein [Hymenobacter sp. BRD67]|uniref:hypothetical protein n=1 Tax=Hymenobacter sp. BRD67 TaxID=2675877 RepID=UPI001563EAAF|nr:hypothetical protein [Hymenobacter sp. BRD67]QKG51408.1 hypothetical protein GKZ67_00915 [Hymenobacter sp. BRD67]